MKLDREELQKLKQKFQLHHLTLQISQKGYILLFHEKVPLRIDK